jgi:hypothetical protein
MQLHYNGSFFFSGARPPPVLYACRASREVALPTFKATFTHRRNTNKPLPPVYIDFALNIIYLTTLYDPWKSAYSELACLFPDARKIQSLAVQISSLDDNDIRNVLTDVIISSGNSRTFE